MPFYFSTFALSLFLIFVAFWLSTTYEKDGIRLKGENASSQLSTLFLFASAFVLVAMIGLRSYEVGTDSYTYARELRLVENGTFMPFDRYSVGYYLITLLVAKVFGGSYTVLYFISGILVIAFLYLSIKENSTNYFVSALIFISFGYMFEALNQVRQLIAVCIILYSFTFLKEGNKKKFVIFVLIASSFHLTALFAFLIYFTPKFRLNSLIGAIALVVVTCLILGYQQISIILSKLPFYGQYIGSVFDSSPPAETMINFLFRALLFFIVLATRNVVSHNHPETNTLINILFLGTCFQALTLSSTVFGRVPIYFISFYIFAIPNLLDTIEQQGYKALATLATCFVFIALFVGITSLKDYSDYTYVPFWDAPMSIGL